MRYGVESLQDESTESLLQMVQTEGLRPMLKHEYERGVAAGRRAQIRTLAPELAPLLENRERQAENRGRQWAREELAGELRKAEAARKEAEEESHHVSDLRWRLDELKRDVERDEMLRKRLAELEAELTKIEARLGSKATP